MRATSSFRDIPRSAKRERTKFDEKQLAYMERFFSTKPYPDGNDRELMAKQLGLTEVKVQIWFKNRRAKDRNQKNLEKLMRASGEPELKRSHSDDNIDSMKKLKTRDSPPPEPNQKDLPETSKDYSMSFHQDWEEKEKSFNGYPEGKDIKYEFGFDPSSGFNPAPTNETLLHQNPMASSQLASWGYNPYAFGYFPSSYYGQNTVSPTMNQMPGYPDIYNNYSQMPSLKDAKF